MRWGNWSLDPKYCNLTHSETGYSVHLADIHSSAAMLDWIFQVQGKASADAKTMHDLLRALEDVLAPQADYCSGEQDLRANGGKLARAYVEHHGG